MTRKKSFIFLLLFFTLLQVGLLQNLRVFGVKPDLFLVCVVVVSLYFDVEYALIFSFLCGILKDTFSIYGFGLNTFFLPVLSFLVMKLSRKVALDNTPVLCAGVFLITIFYDIIIRIISGYLGAVIPFWAFLRISLLESLYTALIFPIAFRLIKRAAHL